MAKLTDYKVNYINKCIEGCDGDLENYLLEKYNVFMIEDLQIKDWDKIEEDMLDFIREN